MMFVCVTCHKDYNWNSTN